MQRVLVLGSGGREHALAWACARDRDDVELICAPGNGGTDAIAENVPLDVTDAPAVARLASERGVDLVVIGPDAAAAAGVADACAAAGIVVFGPSAAAARIESSKSFAKQVMADATIPTARWMAGGRDDLAALLAFVDDLGGRCAVKADGLALGKGVAVCEIAADARSALEARLLRGSFGAAGERVVVEELLYGDEVSVLGICDGRNIRVLPTARDHKRALDGDRGPNTGGMGAVAPARQADANLAAVALEQALQPCVDSLREGGTPFVGCLYAGLMLTDSGLRVLEYNARFGDPEAQVVLPLLREPLLELLHGAARGEVSPGSADAAPDTAVGVVIAAAGYPGAVHTGDEISGVDSLDPDVLCFHAGTRSEQGALRTAGGRVLCIVARDADEHSARRRAYENVSRVHFQGMQFRADIGRASTRGAPAMSGAST
jgi:phosphoribosylamine---glycine ligase